MTIENKLFKQKLFLKLVLLIGVYFMLANKIEAQTEQNQPVTDSNDLVLLNNYNVDLVSTYETVLLNINQKVELDSLVLGQVYEVTYQFVNNESKPIKMKDVLGPCTCMNYEWYTQAIAAGATGWIKIKYKASIPEKVFSNLKIILYDVKDFKPVVIIPIKISANVKFPNTN